MDDVLSREEVADIVGMRPGTRDAEVDHEMEQAFLVWSYSPDNRSLWQIMEHRHESSFDSNSNDMSGAVGEFLSDTRNRSTINIKEAYAFRVLRQKRVSALREGST